MDGHNECSMETRALKTVNRNYSSTESHITISSMSARDATYVGSRLAPVDKKENTSDVVAQFGLRLFHCF